MVKKKREYRKRKHKQVIQQQREHTVTSVQQSHYNDIDVLHPDFSSEDEGLSPVRLISNAIKLRRPQSISNGNVF